MEGAGHARAPTCHQPPAWEKMDNFWPCGEWSLQPEMSVLCLIRWARLHACRLATRFQPLPSLATTSGHLHRTVKYLATSKIHPPDALGWRVGEHCNATSRTLTVPHSPAYHLLPVCNPSTIPILPTLPYPPVSILQPAKSIPKTIPWRAMVHSLSSTFIHPLSTHFYPLNNHLLGVRLHAWVRLCLVARLTRALLLARVRPGQSTCSTGEATAGTSAHNF